VPVVGVDYKGTRVEMLSQGGPRPKGDLLEAVQAISAELKPFDAADFRAKEVQDRGGDDQD
jgi:hypothetical protein